MVINFIRVLLISSLGSLYFIPRKTIKRFLPVTTMSLLITMTINFIGAHFNLFKVKGGISNKIINILSLVLCGFSVATFWTFKLTYGKFWLYLLTNLLQNLLFSFPLIAFFEKTQFLNYVKFSRYHHFYLSMAMALFLYGYQKFIDK